MKIDRRVFTSLPDKLAAYVGGNTPCLYDRCGEPIAWGFVVETPDIWENYEYGYLQFMKTDKCWYLIIKELTPEDAIELYGSITKLESGPRGEFKSVTYGTTKFTSRQLDPRMPKTKAA